MYSIFVNYRGGSHSVSVVALADRLAHHFGDDEVFIDKDMESGEDYPRKLKESLRGCDVLVALIHPDWVASFDTPRRKDWVRDEIAFALDNGITVIPVLLDGTARPAWDQLPPEVADITLRQYAHLRAREFRSDVDHLIRRIEHHVDLDDEPPPQPPIKVTPKRTAVKIAGLALLLFLVSAIVFFESAPLWQMFAVPAFVSAALLAMTSTATVILTWSLREVGMRWERRAGTRTHREMLSRNWLLPALWIVFCAFFVSRAMAQGDWQEWNWWFLVVTVLLGAAYLHRWWRLTTAGDNAWPPPVTTDHGVFRRAALRLHDRLTTDREWRRPRSRRIQRQAESIYLDLAQVRTELTARAALPITRWIHDGYDKMITIYLAWFGSIVLLDLSSVAALVFGDPVRKSPVLIIAATVAGSALFTTAIVTSHHRLDRYRLRKWIDELVDWQKKLLPLIVRTDGSALREAREQAETGAKGDYTGA